MNAQDIMDRFFYRKSPFAVKTAQGFYVPVKKDGIYRDVTLGDIEKHLSEKHTIGAYQSRSDETCVWGCIDFDDKKYKGIAEHFHMLSPSTTMLEETNRGYHVWKFFNSPVSTFYMYHLLLNMLRVHNLVPGLNSKIDIFPRSEHLSGKRFGGLVRIPRF